MLWWGGGGTRKATESLVFRVRRTNTSFLYPSAPHAHTRVYTITLPMDVIMKCDDFVFQFDTITNQVRYRTRATWWRSRPAHNLQRSNGAGLPCHPRTPPKAAQPKAQIQAAVQTMLTAKRNVGTTCENVKRRWRVASAGSWPFGLSEISANPNTGKDLGTKLLDTSAPFS